MGHPRFLAPAPPAPRLPPEEVRRLYPLYRRRILEAAFAGYAMFYLVRNNLPVVSAEMGQALGYDKSMIGDILAATAISYGVGKLVMGWLSDRSSPRRFIALGLLLTALLNFLYGASSSFRVHLALWALNGFVQGMGYGPCATSLAHWYGLKERGAVFGVWNMAHNVGGGIVGVLAAWAASHFGWRSAFYVPGAIALAGAAYLLWRMRDAPPSVGLPPIEEHLGEPPAAHDRSATGEVPGGIVTRYILPNRTLWLIAFANFFVYIARYSMLDWGPTYLKEVKGASIHHGGASTLLIEFAGALGMLATGWISDRIGGRRGLVSAVCMAPTVLAFWAITATPASMLWLDMTLLAAIGFLVYAPVMMLGVMSLDLTAKEAAGTAAGFVGLFGYLGRVAQGKGIGWIAQHYGWTPALHCVLACAVAASLLLALTWNVRPRE
ncbi:MAG: MFS transporter [Elusimicrobia bacterium]|nr:MFS transporter [Elusimicrobiota bacterium]